MLLGCVLCLPQGLSTDDDRVVPRGRGSGKTGARSGKIVPAYSNTASRHTSLRTENYDLESPISARAASRLVAKVLAYVAVK